jgi:osmotically-inducible protein OsmY
MRNPPYVLALALLLGGCPEPLLAAHEPSAARMARAPLIGTSTHRPVPRTAGNETAVEEPTNVQACAPPEEPMAAREASAAGGLSDEEITRELRIRLLSDDGLSSTARKVEIETRNGVVTLHGHTATVRERDQIDAHAHAIRGVARVDDLLHVAR